ncbi:MAG TPA: hypothetical protein VKV15_24720 [Bryobacteraceae bacterium]|nr:hypothetical protein [Bryobacteraceae bacterium]
MYPIVSSTFIAVARRAPVSNTIRRYADELRFALQGLDQCAPDASAADGRVRIHPLDFGRRLVQPPHRSAAYRYVIDIGDQERAVAPPPAHR